MFTCKNRLKLSVHVADHHTDHDLSHMFIFSALLCFFLCPSCKWRHSGMFLWCHVLVLFFTFSLPHGFRLLQIFNNKSNPKSPCVFLHLCVSHCLGEVNEDNVKTHGVCVGMWGWWSGNSSCTLYSYIVANMQVLSPFASVIDDNLLCCSA